MAEEGELYTHNNLREHGSKGFFHIEKHGDNKVSLRTHHNKYVAADSSGFIYLTHQHHEFETKFFLEWFQGRVAFRSHHMGYISITYDGSVCLQNRLGEEQLFFVVEEQFI